MLGRRESSRQTQANVLRGYWLQASSYLIGGRCPGYATAALEWGHSGPIKGPRAFCHPPAFPYPLPAAGENKKRKVRGRTRSPARGKEMISLTIPFFEWDAAPPVTGPVDIFGVDKPKTGFRNQNRCRQTGSRMTFLLRNKQSGDLHPLFCGGRGSRLRKLYFLLAQLFYYLVQI